MWKIDDVSKHIKGLDDKKSKQWVQVANSVYEKCMADGGSDKSCAPTAIRQANGVVNHSDMGVYFQKTVDYKPKEKSYLG